MIETGGQLSAAPSSKASGNKRNTMNEWAKALPRERRGLVSALNAPRRLGLVALERMGLPVAPNITYPLLSVLNDEALISQRLNSELFYAIVEHQKDPSKRRSEVGFNITRLLEWLEPAALSEEADKYTVTVTEFRPNEYGGNITIDQNGYVHIEFWKGEQGPIAAGMVESKLYADRNPYTGTWYYPSVDQETREHLAYNLMPYLDQGAVVKAPRRNAEYQPGYYEFALVRLQPKDPHLSPQFFDYRPELFFLKPEPGHSFERYADSMNYPGVPQIPASVQ